MKVNFFNGSGGSGVSVPNPKVYQSIITQSGTNAPTEVVFRNDFGSAMSFTWSYIGVGDYKATGIYDFLSPNVLDKIILFTSNMSASSNYFLSPYFSVSGSSPNFVAKDIRVIQELGGGAKVNGLVKARFEIRLYN